jgi:hypothetical protein
MLLPENNLPVWVSPEFRWDFPTEKQRAPVRVSTPLHHGEFPTTIYLYLGRGAGVVVVVVVVVLEIITRVALGLGRAGRGIISM